MSKCLVCPENAYILQSKSLIKTVRFCRRTSPRLLCVATQQQNTGQNLEEEQSQSQNEQKVEPASAGKMLTEEKAKLEEQLKEVTVSVFLKVIRLHTLQTAHLRAFTWVLSAQPGYSWVTAV